MMASNRTVAFVSPLGGVGQTTLVANLAHVLTSRGQACLALDLCAQNGLGLHLGLPEPANKGWTAQATDNLWLGDAALENSDHVKFLPFGEIDLPGLDYLEQLCQQHPDWLAHQVRALGLATPSLILLDAPIWPHTLALQALRSADLVVVALDSSTRACQAYSQVLQLLSHAHDGARHGVVATRFDPRRDTHRGALQTLQQQWNKRLAHHVLHEDESVLAATAAATCTTAMLPYAQSAHDMQGLASWLMALFPQVAGAAT